MDRMIPGDERADFFFIAKKWQVEPKIMEPEKCDAIGWFSLDKLPDPISYITGLDIAKYREQMKK